MSDGVPGMVPESGKRAPEGDTHREAEVQQEDTGSESQETSTPSQIDPTQFGLLQKEQAAWEVILQEGEVLFGDDLLNKLGVNKNKLPFKGWIGDRDTLTEITYGSNSSPERPLLRVAIASEKAVAINARVFQIDERGVSNVSASGKVGEAALGLGGFTIGLLSAYPEQSNPSTILIPFVHFDDNGRPTASSRTYAMSYGDFTNFIARRLPDLCTEVSNHTPQLAVALKKVTEVLNDKVAPSLQQRQ